MSAGLPSVIAATAQWLIRAYPPPGGAFTASLALVQARQSATVAAWLRYPTAMDAALLDLVGPGGSGRLDWLAGVDDPDPSDADHVWRTWVDEVVASWAACLLADTRLAADAVAALAGNEHAAGVAYDFPRLLTPDKHDWRAGALLRHPDLLASVADLHRTQLMERIQPDPVDAVD